MTGRCTVCVHAKCHAIDTALVSLHPLRTIADRFGVSKTSLLRHRSAHLPRQLKLAQDAEDLATAESLFANVCKIRKRSERIYKQASKSGDLRTAIAAIRELRELLELHARIFDQQDRKGRSAEAGNHEIADIGTVGIAIKRALARFPKARAAAARALEGLDARSNVSLGA